MSGAVIRLVPKMAAIEATLAACRSGDCQPQDVAVVAYIVSSIDRDTGDCTRHYATIGEACGMSRSAAGRSIKRLVDAGIIERAPRQARNGAQICTAFTIARRPTSGTPSSHQRDSYKDSSRFLQYPVVGQEEKRSSGVTKKAKRPSPATDWGAWQDWLADQVNYPKHWSDGRRSDARGDLEQLREAMRKAMGDDEAKGDVEALQALETAKRHGWYGPKLRTILLEWTPAKRRVA